MQMVPRVGMVVHVNRYRDSENGVESSVPCRAFLITGIDGKTLYGSAHSNRGDASRAVVTDDGGWHDIYFCPSEMQDATNT